MYNTNPYNPYTMNAMPQTQNNNNINWVQGIEGAKAFQLTPNSNVILMDSENDGIFYIKTSDNVGMCKLRTFRYEEIDTTTPNMSDYVKKSEVEDIVRSIIRSKNNEQSVSTTKSNNKQYITK